MVLNISTLYPAYNAERQGKRTSAPVINKPEQRKVLPESHSLKNLKKDLFETRQILNKLDSFDKVVTPEKLDSSKTVLGALGVVPTFRRINSLPDSLQRGDFERAAGLAFLTAANFPGDMREMAKVGREITGKFKNPFVSQATNMAKSVPPGWQTEFTFFKGTFVEKYLNKLGDKAKWLTGIDKTLYETKAGKFIAKIFNVSSKYTKEINTRGIEAGKYFFKGKPLQKIVGRTLARTSVLGTLVMSALEIPAIIRSVKKEGSITDKMKSLTGQLCKSAGYILFVTGGIALAGAAATVLFPVGGIPSLLGMAAGSYGGLTISRNLNKQIDKIFAPASA